MKRVSKGMKKMLQVTVLASIILTMKRYILDIDYETPNCLGYFVGFIHNFFCVFVRLLALKSIFYKVELWDYIVLVILLQLLLIGGIIYKQCILTAYENKLLKLDERHTWGLSLVSTQDMDAMKKGYILPLWINTAQMHFYALLAISIKFFYETFM